MNNAVKILLTLFPALFLCLSNPVHADYQVGQQALEQGNLEMALVEWRLGAKQGDPLSLYGLGQLYETGQGVQADAAIALLYYQLAAANGLPEAEQPSEMLKQLMSPADVEWAQSMAIKMKALGVYLPEDLEAASSGFQLSDNCNLRPMWKDKGSGGRSDVTLYLPTTSAGNFTIGGYAQGNYNNPAGCVRTVMLPGGMGIDQTPLLVQPVDFRLLWTDKGAGASQDGSIWRAVPPSNDYICLGDVPQSGYGKPRIADFACVHFCAVEQVSPLGPVWTTERTGARQNIAIYTLPVSNTFTVVDPGSTQAVFDLGQANQCADL